MAGVLDFDQDLDFFWQSGLDLFWILLKNPELVRILQKSGFGPDLAQKSGFGLDFTQKSGFGQDFTKVRI